MANSVRDAVASAMARSPLYQQAAQKQWPMIDLSRPNYDEPYNHGGVISSPLEDAIDEYTRQMNENDTFSVRHPGGDIYQYRYLGPNSGGRKDWLWIRPPSPDEPMS